MLRLIVLLILLCAPAWADSPLTSTMFWKAYRDVPQVVEAHDIGRLNTRLGYYLLSGAPLDKKAAVINALSWNYEGRENAMLFREILEQKYKTRAFEGRLTGEETFCLGYLTALDDYFHPEKAAPYLDRARAKLPRSFTVAMVRGLNQGQLHFKDFKQVWADTAVVLNNRALVRDLRPQAVKIVVDYMKLYENG